MSQKIGQIKSIWRYPIKSMVGSQIGSAELTKKGLEGDRQWVLWDEVNNQLIGGKQFKNIMRLVAASTQSTGVTNTPSIDILFPDGKKVASDAPYLNDLLSTFIGHPVSLKHRADHKDFYLLNKEGTSLDKVRQQLGMPPETSLIGLASFPLRITLLLGKYATPPNSLHDVYPVHFLTSNTLNWLSKNNPAANIDVRRFRPTFVIEGLDSLGDYPESKWDGGTLEIGNTVIKVGHPTIRCSMPAQAQPELEQDIEVAKVIQTTAKQFVGSYATVMRSGKITEGDEVIYRPAKKFWQLQSKFFRKMRNPVIASVIKLDSITTKRTKSKETSISITDSLKKNGFEAFKIVKIVEESATIKSFYLQGANFYSFLPGQHLIIGLDIPNQPHPVIRAYSLSNYIPSDKTYRISVNREGKDALASTYLHDHVKKGDQLFIKRPKGQFFLHPQENRPIALISMGIGVTPFMSMVDYAHKTKRTGKISFLHGCRNGQNHPFKKELKTYAEQGTIQAFTCYSQPIQSDNDFQKAGYVDIAAIKEVVKSVDTVFFLCGSDEFMRTVYRDLIDWGVQPKDIRYEQFSKSSPIEGNHKEESSTSTYEILFTHSNVKTTWSSVSNNLLDLAENSGLKPNFGCRYGMCDACEVKLKEGSVTYNSSIPKGKNEDTVLLCCAIPTSNLVIEL